MNKIIGEALARNVEYRPIGRAADKITNGLNQVGLAQAHPTVNKQWVVGNARFFSHGQASSMGELIGVAGDKVSKSVRRVKSKFVGGSRARRGDRHWLRDALDNVG